MNSLAQILSIDPVAKAVFAEHNVDPQFLDIGVIHPDLLAQLNPEVEDPALIAHKLAHLLADAKSKGKQEYFVVNQPAVQQIENEIYRRAHNNRADQLFERFASQYQLGFSDKEVAKASLKRTIAAAKKQLHKLQFSPEENDVLNKIRVAAVEMEAHAYLVGGCLRDRLLGIVNHDLDFMVVTKDLKRFVDYVVQKYSLRQPVHLERSDAFTLRIGSIDVDIIEARKVYTPLQAFSQTTLEGDEEFTIALDDAFRRDLTINALMYDLNNNEVKDPTKRGFNDLQNGIVNTIIDPYVKYRINAPDMLRALRFAAVLDFKLGPEMIAAMKSNVDKVKPRDKGGDISPRRIKRELRKAADNPNSWYRFKKMALEIGLYDYLQEEFDEVEKDRVGKGDEK